MWSEVLAADPGATVYQTLPWFDAALEYSNAKDVSRLYVTEDMRLLVLPLLRREPLPGMALDGSYPGVLGPGGLIASGGLRPSDVRLVLSDLLRSRTFRTSIKVNHDVAGLWQAGLVDGTVGEPFRVEVLDLDGGFRKVWDERFQSSARRAVRKAERSRIVVERDTTGSLIGTFYELYLDWTYRRAEESGLPKRVAAALAQRREPLRMFEILTRSLGDKCRIWLASHDGEVVAGLLSLVHGRYSVYWRGYSKKALAGPLRANNLLQRLAIEDACDAGCRYYSMGQSSGVTALEHFKQTMGATPRSALELRIERLPIGRLERLTDQAASRVERLVRSGLQVTRRD